MLLTAATAFTLGWTVPLPLARSLLARRGLEASHHTIITTISVHDAPSSPGMALIVRKAVCASTLMLYGLGLAWQHGGASVPCLLLVAGGACMLCVLACDLRARIVPWELCAALLALGCLYELLACDARSLFAALCASGIVVAALCLSRLLARLVGSGEPLGAGDVRLVPGLFAACGLTGSLWGACACVTAMGAGAACVLVRMLCARHSQRERAPARYRARGASGSRHGGQHGAQCDGQQPREHCTSMRQLAQSTTMPLAPGLCLWFAVGTLCV